MKLTRRLRYRFDNFMARGTVALVGGLAAVSLCLALLGTLVFHLFELGPGTDGGSAGVIETFWYNAMRLFDPSAVEAGEGTWGFVIATFILSLGGVFIASALIGLLTAGIDSKLQDLTKGRSEIVEQGHTVILGWSSSVCAIVENLVEANASQRGTAIVLLVNAPKVEVEREIRERIPNTRGTRIVVRTGNTTAPRDLRIVSPQTARSIIVVAPDAEDPDGQTIRTLMALARVVHDWSRVNVVSQLVDPQNREVIGLIAPEARIRTVEAGDLIARIIVQSGRQSGLSEIYAELLDYADNEIYFHHHPQLSGRTFRQAVFCYETGLPIGIRRKNGAIELLPRPDTRFAAGDEAILIAIDDTPEYMSFHPDRVATIEDRIIPPESVPSSMERTLIIGWNRRVPGMIRELFTYVTPDSTVTVASAVAIAGESIEQIRQEFGSRVTIVQTQTTSGRNLRRLEPESYDQIIVVAYSDWKNSADADSDTLVTLLHLRDIANSCPDSRFSIVTEMLDVRNRELAEIADPDDFVVDERLVSLMLSQVSETPDLEEVYRELFSAEGSEIYLRPLEWYVMRGSKVGWDTIAAAALDRGEIAIGYRRAALARDPTQRFGIRLNPPKESPIRVSDGDMIIVLGDDGEGGSPDHQLSHLSTDDSERCDGFGGAGSSVSDGT